MVGLSRRHLLGGGAAALASGAFLGAAQANTRLLMTPQAEPAKPVGIPEPSPVKIIEGFEPSRSGISLEREVVFVLDFSDSMDEYEVTRGVAGVISGIKTSKLLAGSDDAGFCSGPVGIGLVTFKSNPVQYGYMVLETPEDAVRAEETLVQYLSSLTTGGQTGTGLGLKEAGVIFEHSPCAQPMALKRTAFVVGDGNFNTGISPKPMAMNLAKRHAVTTHCVALSGGLYEGVPNPAMTVQPVGARYSVDVDAGEVRIASSSEDIANFIQEKIDPNCTISMRDPLFMPDRRRLLRGGFVPA